MKLHLLLPCLMAVQVLGHNYHIDIVTGSRKYDDSDGTFRAILSGKKGSLEFGVLDNPNYDDFKLGAMDNFQKSSDKDLGKINCVELEARGSKSDDAWMVDYLIVSKGAGSATTHLYNTDGTYLSSDTSEGANIMDFCRQGDATYTFEITTANEKWADTDNIHARITVSSKGNKGNTTTGILDNRGIDDFVRGNTDVFTIPDLKNVGKMGCVTLTAEQDDAWLFDTIKVTRGKQTKTFKNTNKVWLSSDLSEGVDYLEICQ